MVRNLSQLLCHIYSKQNNICLAYRITLGLHILYNTNMSNSFKLETKVKTSSFCSKNGRNLNVSLKTGNEGELSQGLHKWLKSMLTLFSEVLPVPGRRSEWKGLSLVPIVMMQNNAYWGSYEKTQVSNLLTSKTAGLVRIRIKDTRKWLRIPNLKKLINTPKAKFWTRKYGISLMQR